MWSRREAARTPRKSHPFREKSRFYPFIMLSAAVNFENLKIDSVNFDLVREAQHGTLSIFDDIFCPLSPFHHHQSSFPSRIAVFILLTTMQLEDDRLSVSGTQQHQAPICAPPFRLDWRVWCGVSRCPRGPGGFPA